jgi:hypothetical protein
MKRKSNIAKFDLWKKQLANKRLVILFNNISKYFCMIDPSQKIIKIKIYS